MTHYKLTSAALRGKVNEGACRSGLDDWAPRLTQRCAALSRIDKEASRREKEAREQKEAKEQRERELREQREREAAAAAAAKASTANPFEGELCVALGGLAHGGAQRPSSPSRWLLKAKAALATSSPPCR